MRAFYQLKGEGLGNTLEVGGTKGTTVVCMYDAQDALNTCTSTILVFFGASIIYAYFIQQYEFEKAKVPDDTEQKVQFAKKLSKYGTSLIQYTRSLLQQEIKL